MSTMYYKTNKELKNMSLQTRIKYERCKREYDYVSKKPIEKEEIMKTYEHNKTVTTALKLERAAERRKVYHLYDARFKADIYEPKRVGLLKVRSMSDAKERISTGQYKSMMKSFANRKNKIGKIFIATHVARYDIETVREIVGTGCFIMIGDMNESYTNFDGAFLKYNGLTCFDTAHKLDRKACLEQCIKILLSGGNIMFFPEGAWNITELEIVMKLFNGAAIMAKETGADVIPIAVEARKNKYYTAVGAPIKIAKDDPRSYREISDNFRDTLTELKVTKILDKIPLIKRSDLPDNAYEYMKAEVMSETANGYTEEEIERTRYHEPKEIEKENNSKEKVYEPIKRLTINKNNAFLLNNKCNGRIIA